MKLRIGQGIDVHAFAEQRKLILCGVEIPHTHGLLGHSDADVAVHALMDAILGALALGDIGHLFPDTDTQYKGINSLLLLQKVMARLPEHHATLENMDITLVMQKPKVASYIPQMRQVLAQQTHIPLDCVSVKATTTEHLGFTGRSEGIAAFATVLIAQSHPHNPNPNS